jgi:hypothetical protein
MLVSELIEYLKTVPQDIPVAYNCYSDSVLMNIGEVGVVKMCKARADGWIQSARPDMEKVEYLLFPGN